MQKRNRIPCKNEIDFKFVTHVTSRPRRPIFNFNLLSLDGLCATAKTKKHSAEDQKSIS